MVTVLDVDDVSKTFRGRSPVRANDHVHLTVEAGRVVGLLGHNGAGKTTLVNQIAGLTRPDSGSIRVAGHDAVSDPDQVRRLINVQAQANVPITGLTPRRAIELVGRIRGASRAHVRARADELLDALELTEWAATPAHKVSGGVARLTAFAMTAVVPGALVILDEPTNDVDPVRRRLLWTQIRRLADDGAGVLLVTHNVREAEHAVDDLVILDRGAVRARGTVAELTHDLRGTLQLAVDLPPAGEIGGHPAHPAPSWPDYVTAVSREGHRAQATVPAGRSAEVVAWAQHAVETGAVDRFSITPASLEDVYIQLVADGPDAGARTDAAGIPTTASQPVEGARR